MARQGAGVLPSIDHDDAIGTYVMLCTATYSWFLNDEKTPRYLTLFPLLLATIDFTALGQFSIQSFAKAVLAVDIGYIAACVTSPLEAWVTSRPE